MIRGISRLKGHRSSFYIKVAESARIRINFIWIAVAINEVFCKKFRHGRVPSLPIVPAILISNQRVHLVNQISGGRIEVRDDHQVARCVDTKKSKEQGCLYRE